MKPGMAMQLAHALAWLRYLAGLLAWPGLLGLALAAAAAGIDLLATGRLVAQNDGLQQEVSRLRRQAAAAAPRELPASEIRSLAQLPGGSDLSPFVAAIHAGARQRQIVLEQGEYVWQEANATRAASYRMTFPARGSYPQVRGWAADLLARHPELVLEQFDFRRDSIASQVVEARVRFALRMEKAA